MSRPQKPTVSRHQLANCIDDLGGARSVTRLNAVHGNEVWDPVCDWASKRGNQRPSPKPVVIVAQFTARLFLGESRGGVRHSMHGTFRGYPASGCYGLEVQ